MKMYRITRSIQNFISFDFSGFHVSKLHEKYNAVEIHKIYRPDLLSHSFANCLSICPLIRNWGDLCVSLNDAQHCWFSLCTKKGKTFGSI